jgi:hypothetical protein
MVVRVQKELQPVALQMCVRFLRQDAPTRISNRVTVANFIPR